MYDHSTCSEDACNIILEYGDAYKIILPGMEMPEKSFCLEL